MGGGGGGSSESHGDARSSTDRWQIVSPIIPENQTTDRLAIRSRVNLYPLGPRCNPREFHVRRRLFDSVQHRAVLNERITNRVDRTTTEPLYLLHFNFDLYLNTILNAKILNLLYLQITVTNF